MYGRWRGKEDGREPEVEDWASVILRRGLLRMGLAADGSMVPCSMLHQLVMGNLLTDDITDAWNNSPAIREVRNRYTVPLRRIPECADCPWVDYCNGGCPGITMQLRRTIAAPGRDGCYRDFLKANGIAGMNQAGVRA
jgi:radical SAM protein with 4Fe4S-binding SPASM domain